LIDKEIFWAAPSVRRKPAGASHALGIPNRVYHAAAG
jgi:hypothetical protein